MAVIHTLREGGGDWSPNKLFSALWASFWSKSKGGQAPRAHPLDPPLSVVAVKSVVAIRASTTHTTVTRATALSGGFRGGARVAAPPPLSESLDPSLTTPTASTTATTLPTPTTDTTGTTLTKPYYTYYTYYTYRSYYTYYRYYNTTLTIATTRTTLTKHTTLTTATTLTAATTLTTPTTATTLTSLTTATTLTTATAASKPTLTTNYRWCLRTFHGQQLTHGALGHSMGLYMNYGPRKASYAG